jgi:hypothetical protein
MIGVDPEVITRLLRLTTLSVELRAGCAVRKHKLVKSGGLDDLVFQSVQGGRPMNGHNMLKRQLQPAARKLGLPFVNWRCLRTSHAIWLVQAGADPKSLQGRMRHSRISTTMDIYARIASASQRRALQQLSVFAGGGGLPAPRPMDLDLDFSLSENNAEGSRITVRFAVQNGPIRRVVPMIETAKKVGKRLRRSDTPYIVSNQSWRSNVYA